MLISESPALFYHFRRPRGTIKTSISNVFALKNWNLGHFGDLKIENRDFWPKNDQKIIFFKKNIQIPQNPTTKRHQTPFFAPVRRSFRSRALAATGSKSKQAYFLGFSTIYIGGTP